MNPPATNSVFPLTLPSDQDASGRQLGAEELVALRAVIQSGTLTGTKGTFVKEFERQFAERLEVPHAVACTSGTAALHAAVAALDLEPGEEIITTSITDMGAITPILYQGAIPVFADVDPRSYNVTAASIARCLSERTRGIMVTHLFGNPCDMGPILQLAKRHEIPVIEDCSQAFLGSDRGQFVGTMGDIGCFSLQQGKHMTTGEGGILVSRSAALARRAFLFVNKGWGYGDPQPDHYFLALNYRMNELTGAVACSQLAKLDHSVARRIQMAELFTERLQGIRGLEAPTVSPHGVHTFWKYTLDVDPQWVPGGTDAVARVLRARGVACAPRYIQKPAFECQVIREQRTFGNSRFPFSLARPEAIDYSPQHFCGTYSAWPESWYFPGTNDTRPTSSMP